MRAARILIISFLSFLAVDSLVFHTRLYRGMLNRDSTAGLVESILTAEATREIHDRNQVNMVGDSRMGFYPRFVDPLTPELGYTFRTIGVAGTSPRCWYYFLREVDPTARRYAAVVIPVDNYEDAEIWEDYANRTVDLNYLIGLLRWRDVPVFANSYRDPQLKLQMLRGLLFKGLVYKRDFQDLLAAPGKRWFELHEYVPHEAVWRYDFTPPADTLKDVHVDWKAKTITGPPDVLAAHELGMRARFLDAPPPPGDRQGEYMHFWLEKIYDYYRDSGTKIIFIRLPRGGFVRPDQPAENPGSSVRTLARSPGVMVAPEHLFDDLERPEFFLDEVHLNAEGTERFSVELAREVRELLGPPHAF